MCLAKLGYENGNAELTARAILCLGNTDSALLSHLVLGWVFLDRRYLYIYIFIAEKSQESLISNGATLSQFVRGDTGNLEGLI